VDAKTKIGKTKPKHGITKAKYGIGRAKYGITKRKYGIVKTYFVFLIPNIVAAISKFDITEAYNGN
jgi:hypothetical protein